MKPTAVLAMISGRDRPGVTAALFAALAAHDVDVRDVEQVVIRERLLLAVLLELRGDSTALRNSVTQTARALGMECEVVLADEPETAEQPPGRRSHVIVLGHPLRPGVVSHIAQSIADRGDNIESVTKLSSDPVTSLEMIVRSEDATDLRAVLMRAAGETGVDIAVERAGLRRRAKRLVVLDLDSTLIGADVIDLLADRAGVRAQLGAVTERAMAGELGFADALRGRVGVLAGLPGKQVEAVRDELVLTPGAGSSVRTLQRLGFRVGVVSAGFAIITDRFVAELGLDFAAANQLEITDGRVTGRLLGPILDRAARAGALRRFAEQYGVPMSQTVAVGDGVDDIDMLEAAGLGIAFNGRSALRTAADPSRELPYLDTVLFVLGIPRRGAIEEPSRTWRPLTVPATDARAAGDTAPP